MKKKSILDSQKHLLEKAELMALFSELDPNPQIRIDKKGKIIKTNDAARSIFKDSGIENRSINEIIPSLKMNGGLEEKQFTDTIEDKIFSINIKPGGNYDFTNIYLHDITKQKNYEASLEEYKNKLKELADKLDFTIEDVKKTVSGELHDDIGQRLLALKLKASQDKTKPEELLPDVESVYQRVRQLSRELRPSDLGKIGLRVSVQSLVENVSNSSGIKGSFEYYGNDEKIEDSLATCIFRVIQEALNNILKHSKAEEFSVTFHSDEEGINFYVIDDGVGIPKEYFEAKQFKNFGIGLFNMKERIEKYNGVFNISSDTETGTVLSVRIPAQKGE